VQGKEARFLSRKLGSCKLTAQSDCHPGKEEAILLARSPAIAS